MSKASKMAGQPLFCEIPLENVTISSSYWNGTQDLIVGCDLKNLSAQEVPLKFPNYKDSTDINGNIKSYILLPNTINRNPYKTSGVYIAASNLVKMLLPGFNNRQVKTFLIYIQCWVQIIVDLNQI